MSQKTLQDLIDQTGNAVKLLRNSQQGPMVYPGVPPEFSNWRDEQRAWRETCVLFDQSHHMTDLYIGGPDVVRLLSHVGVNSFKGFEVNKAKQLVVCNPDGYVIGDSILFFLDQDRVSLVGRPSSLDWVQYNAEAGKFDVKVERDERSAVNTWGRKFYRFQLQGPTALNILEKLHGQALPEIKFFNMGEFKIAGRRVRALRHGMSGVPGFELFGPKEEGAEITAAIVEAGAEFGLRQGGYRAYTIANIESGWIPSPLPAIFSGENMRAYREWLPANWFDSRGTLGGSFSSDQVRDFYLTPYELGYGPMVKFDHDFIGREALEKIARHPTRKRVTLAWNGGDVTRAIGTMFERGESVKYIDWPRSDYSTWPYDMILSGNRTIGVSTSSGYSFNEKAMLSLGIVDIAQSEPGTEVTLVWGESGGGTSKPTVERHVQTEIRAIVSPVPYSEVARTSYAEGWRTAQKVSV
jgi:vanillate/3-O-methylgallate O-demethylase